MSETMRQYAPYPTELAAIVDELVYRPGWQFTLRDIQRDGDAHSGSAGGLTLRILAWVFDAYHQDELRPVYHYAPVPAATYNRTSWERWVFDQILRVEQHEAAEYFQLGDRRPFAPTHGPGDDPYVIVQYASEEQRRTSFRGELNDD
jgi:hypothetical protein